MRSTPRLCGAVPSDLAGLEPERVLLIKPSSLGDVVDAMPVAVGLRRRYPRARLAWLVREGYEALVRSVPEVDEVVTLAGRRGFLGRAAGLRRAGRVVRRQHFDLSVDVQGLFRSAWVGWRGRIPVRVGLATAREGAGRFYTHRVPVPTSEVHAVERYWLAARALGCAGNPPPVRLCLPRRTVERVRERLGGAPGPLVVMLPGARWPKKRWPADRFAAVAGALADRAGAHVVVAGDDADRQAGAAIAGAAPGVTDLTGSTDLVELAALLAQAALVVTVDTGPMHLAAALGRPVVAVFGPTNPVRTGPYGAGHVVLTAGLDCQPCYRRRCRDVRCLAAVPAETVTEAALDVLGRANSKVVESLLAGETDAV